MTSVYPLTAEKWPNSLRLFTYSAHPKIWAERVETPHLFMCDNPQNTLASAGIHLHMTECDSLGGMWLLEVVKGSCCIILAI